MFLLNKVVWCLTNPYQVGFLIVVIGFALIAACRHGRTLLGTWLVWTGFLWLYVWSSGFLFVDAATELTSRYPPKLADAYPKADAIVELGGGMGINTNIQFYAEIHPEADRVWFASELWKAGKAPVIIPSTKYAEFADKQLLLSLGVPETAIVVEDRARNTEENAKFIQAAVKRIVRENGRSSSESRPKILVVTSVWHMRRAMLMFERYAPEIEAIPAPTDFGRVGTEVWWRRVLPFIDHFDNNQKMFHEWLGYWGYRLLRK